MSHVVGLRAKDHIAASSSQIGRIEAAVLTQPEPLEALICLSGQWIDWLRQRKTKREITLALDCSVSETFGRRERSTYNSHFRCNCYHPLFCFNQLVGLERAMLREGNAHSVEDWRSDLERVVDC